MKEYMLIIKGDEPGYKNWPKAKLEELGQKYAAFVGTLKSKHGFSDGSELNTAGFELTPNNGQIAVDGPFAETKEVVSGYFVFNAPNIDAAVNIAKLCPALTVQNLPCQIFELSR